MKDRKEEREEITQYVYIANERGIFRSDANNILKNISERASIRIIGKETGDKSEVSLFPFHKRGSSYHVSHSSELAFTNGIYSVNEFSISEDNSYLDLAEVCFSIIDEEEEE